MNEISDVWKVLSGIALTCATWYFWFKTIKPRINKTVSDNNKSVTENTVESNKAMLLQMDYFLNQITAMYESSLKDKVELSESRTKHLEYIERENKYKLVINEIKKSCDACKTSIEKTLKHYEL